jgi:N-acetylmannosamine-6-phosphate 2-epimerase/N-acetylmannosamine kinase
MTLAEFCQSVAGKLIVSCQAEEGEAFYGRVELFARAALAGGAVAIRANGAFDVRAVCQAVPVPVIGIHKALHSDGRILITPDFASAKEVVDAGAALVALDCTQRGQAAGAFDRLQRIKKELKTPVLADIATVEEAVAAQQAGADLILSTMRGYTDETRSVKQFEPGFIRALTRAVSIPVIAEGRIDTPEQARQAIRAGALSVVIGTAITRPRTLTARFVAAVEDEARLVQNTGAIVAVDLGGTNTKFGVVSKNGALLFQGSRPTPARAGRQALLKHLAAVSRQAMEQGRALGLQVHSVGIATAGWVNAETGSVAYATDNLPEWTGTAIADYLRAELRLPVVVENDANAQAIGEHLFGAAQSLRDFVCITIGTGIGGGCFVGGRLNRGAHYFANALGHIPIEVNGRACNCGQSGCLEAYTNSAALLAYAGGQFTDCEQLIQAAGEGDETARNAIRQLAKYLASGCAVVLQLLDPEALIIGGGVAEGNQLLLETLREELANRIPTWQERKLQLLPSSLGYYAGVLGAAAIAIQQQHA